MNRKKWFSVIALICILIALLMFTTLEKTSNLHNLYWIPLVISAVSLFAATRIK